MDRSEREVTLEDQMAYFDTCVKGRKYERFIIAVPSIPDEETDHNANANAEKQYQEALIFAEHIKKKMNTDLVEISNNCFDVHIGSCQPLIAELDFLVFLHDFWEKEQTHIIHNIRESRQFAFNVFDLKPDNIRNEQLLQ